jgi:hypothetical protein
MSLAGVRPSLTALYTILHEMHQDQVFCSCEAPKSSSAPLHCLFNVGVDEPKYLRFSWCRTGQDIPDDVVYQLASHPNFLGVKECTGNPRIQVQMLAQCMLHWLSNSSHVAAEPSTLAGALVKGQQHRIMLARAMRATTHAMTLTRVWCCQNYANHGVRCWSGNDDEAHAGRHHFGAQGVISVTSNLLPGLYSRLMREPDQELMDSLQDLVAWLFCEPNPIPVNTAMVSCSSHVPCGLA